MTREKTVLLGCRHDRFSVRRRHDPALARLTPSLLQAFISAEAVLEAVLCDGQAPVLVLAKDNAALARFGPHIVVGWDQSREAMEAVRRALPLLIAAVPVMLAH